MHSGSWEYRYMRGLLEDVYAMPSNVCFRLGYSSQMLLSVTHDMNFKTSSWGMQCYWMEHRHPPGPGDYWYSKHPVAMEYSFNILWDEFGFESQILWFYITVMFSCFYTTDTVLKWKFTCESARPHSFHQKWYTAPVFRVFVVRNMHMEDTSYILWGLFCTAKISWSWRPSESHLLRFRLNLSWAWLRTFIYRVPTVYITDSAVLPSS